MPNPQLSLVGAWCFLPVLCWPKLPTQGWERWHGEGSLSGGLMPGHPGSLLSSLGQVVCSEFFLSYTRWSLRSQDRRGGDSACGPVQA